MEASLVHETNSIFLSLIFRSTPLFMKIQNGGSVSGQIKVKTCLKCPGLNKGLMYPMIPNRAGQKRLYIERQIKSFSGSDFGKTRFLRAETPRDGK